jgi:hypothetical protein
MTMVRRITAPDGVLPAHVAGLSPGMILAPVLHPIANLEEKQ